MDIDQEQDILPESLQEAHLAKRQLEGLFLSLFKCDSVGNGKAHAEAV